MLSGQWLLNFCLIHCYWVKSVLWACKNGYSNKDEQHLPKCKTESLWKLHKLACHRYSYCDNLIRWEKRRWGICISPWKPLFRVEADPWQIRDALLIVTLWTTSSRNISEQEANWMGYNLPPPPAASFTHLPNQRNGDSFVPQIIICVLVSDFVLNAQLENHKPGSQKWVCFASWAEYPFKKALIINFHELNKSSKRNHKSYPSTNTDLMNCSQAVTPRVSNWVMSL